MLTGKVNENIKKNNNRSNQQKSNFARAVRLFCTFLCRCFARLQRETSRNFLLYTFYGGNVGRVLVHFFFHCRSFSPWWLLASRRYQISFCSKNVSFCFFSLTLAAVNVELRFPASDIWHIGLHVVGVRTVVRTYATS